MATVVPHTTPQHTALTLLAEANDSDSVVPLSKHPMPAILGHAHSWPTLNTQSNRKGSSIRQLSGSSKVPCLCPAVPLSERLVVQFCRQPALLYVERGDQPLEHSPAPRHRRTVRRAESAGLAGSASPSLTSSRSDSSPSFSSDFCPGLHNSLSAASVLSRSCVLARQKSPR